MNKNKQIEIEKPYVIAVEGKLDEIIVKLILKSLAENKQVLNNIQVFSLDGKYHLKLKNMKRSVELSHTPVRGILIVLDKDESYTATKQKLENFLSDLGNQYTTLNKKDCLIIPDEQSSGKELEDYIIEAFKKTDTKANDIITSLEKCIKETATNKKKLGKKIFYTYLLMIRGDKCKYEGLSISEGMLQGCIYEILKECISEKNLNLITDKISDFLNYIVSDMNHTVR